MHIRNPIKVTKYEKIQYQYAAEMAHLESLINRNSDKISKSSKNRASMLSQF